MSCANLFQSLPGLKVVANGDATLAAGVVAVANPSVGINDIVIVSPVTAVANVAVVGCIVAGTGISIQSSSNADARSVNYIVLRQAPA